MKKLVNHPSDVVREMLEGIARQSPQSPCSATNTC